MTQVRERAGEGRRAVLKRGGEEGVGAVWIYILLVMNEHDRTCELLLCAARAKSLC